MSGERLKGSVSVRREVAMPGRYSNLSLTFSEEFYLEESSLEEKTDELLGRLKVKDGRP